MASFAHDSLIWGMFAAVLNRSNPELFVSQTGEYTLMNLFGDGSTHSDTNSQPAADMTRIGWPGEIIAADQLLRIELGFSFHT